MYFTSLQHEQAKDELIAALVGARCKPLLLELEDSIEDIAKYGKAHTQPKTSHCMNATQNRAVGKAMPLINDKDLQQLRMLKNADELGGLSRAWILRAYAHCDTPELHKFVSAYYHQRNKIRKGTEATIERLIDMAIIDAIGIIYDRPKLKYTMIAKYLNVNPKTFRDSWLERYESLYKLLRELDEAVLDFVCVNLKFDRYQPALKTNHHKALDLLSI